MSKGKKPQRVIITITDEPGSRLNVRLKFVPDVKANAPMKPSVQCAMRMLDVVKSMAAKRTEDPV